MLKRIPYYQVNAFTTNPFGGNPAGVCLLEEWLPDALLQQIAAENNLAETAFLVRDNRANHLRWFSPTVEVDLCGHATLGTAFVLLEELNENRDSISFQTRSGELVARRREQWIELDFPSRPGQRCEVPEKLVAGLGATPREVYKSRDYMAVFEHASQVADLRPDFETIKELDCLGVIATAPGGDCDFVSRFFPPSIGVPEDPVTGSAHCTLIPYWSGRLGKTELRARQISRRGGELFCRDLKDRAGIGGRAVLYSRGEIIV